MRFKTLAGAVLAASLVSSVAVADIQSDLDANLSQDMILQNALDSGLSLKQIMAQLQAINPDLVESFVSAAITAGMDAREVVTAAIEAGANEQQVQVAAITAGADPTLVTEATAAGRPTLPTVNAQGFRVAQIDPTQTGSGTTFAPGLQAPSASPN